jgi:HEAT repeat protein
MKFLISFLLLFALPVFSTNPPPQIYFLLSQGRIQEGMELYKQYRQTLKTHDHAALSEISLTILEQAIKQPAPETQLVALFGASISLNDRSNSILLKGVNSPIPEIQAISINLLAKQPDDDTAGALLKMVSSPHLILRLEAIYQLAQRKDPRAAAQIEALIYKVDPRLTPLFPPLLNLLGTPAALSTWRKLFTHSLPETRVSSVLAAAEGGQDGFLPLIKKMAQHPDVREQEAAAYALGIFQDSGSTARLQQLTRSPHPHVKLAALLALYQLGEKERLAEIQRLAADGFPFAAASLESTEGVEGFLAALLRHPSAAVRLNATLSLLLHKDPRALPGLTAILIPDSRQLAFVPFYSPGKSQKIWKTVPSQDLNEEKEALIKELSLQFREEVLEQSLELPLSSFLGVADQLFQARQNDLIPLLIELLVNLDHELVIERLNKWKNQLGAPLIRTYALIGLVRLGQKEYVAELKSWILAQQAESFEFRSFVPLENRIEKGETYVLTPSENARLMMGALEALILFDAEEALDVLVDLLSRSNQENSALIAGVLLRTLCR